MEELLTRRNLKIFGGSVFGALILLNSFVSVDSGRVGFRRTFGAVSHERLDPGLHLKLFWQSAVTEDTRMWSYSPGDSLAASSKDLQTVRTKVAVQWSLDPSLVSRGYTLIGLREQLQSAVIAPGVQQTLKQVSARFSTEELITQRAVVQAELDKAIREYVGKSLDERGVKGLIIIGQVALTDFSFDPEFEKSIEAKARAEQNKLRALTEKETAITQAEGEAEAAVKKAEGEAKAIRLQTEALRTNPGYSEYIRAKKWNGQLPTVVGGHPIVRIDELAAGASGK